MRPTIRTTVSTVFTPSGRPRTADPRRVWSRVSRPSLLVVALGLALAGVPDVALAVAAVPSGAVRVEDTAPTTGPGRTALPPRVCVGCW